MGIIGKTVLISKNVINRLIEKYIFMVYNKNKYFIVNNKMNIKKQGGQNNRRTMRAYDFG